jgi:ribonuclease P protein component
MKRRFRLRRRQDFDRVMRSQRVYAGRALVAFARPGIEGRWRVGVTVSRRLRGAVRRNLLRRRLREVARVRLLPSDAETRDDGAGYDVVLIGRPAALDLPLAALEEETARVRDRLREPRG